MCSKPPETDLFTSSESLRDISKAQRRTFTLTLAEYGQRYDKRDEAMAKAYYSGTYTMKEIGEYFRVHAVTGWGVRSGSMKNGNVGMMELTPFACICFK